MKKSMIFISIILLIWLVFLSTDLILAERDHRPFFCVDVPLDGRDEIRYIGLFYQVYHVVEIEDDVVVHDYGYVIVPWFYGYDRVLEEMKVSFIFLSIKY